MADIINDSGMKRIDSCEILHLTLHQVYLLTAIYNLFTPYLPQFTLFIPFSLLFTIYIHPIYTLFKPYFLLFNPLLPHIYTLFTPPHIYPLFALYLASI